MTPDLLLTRKNITFDECMNLVSQYDNFDYIDDTLPTGRTRTFNYRLNIYEDFLMPGSRNLRGITFNLDTKELLALPFFKFFNINENPFTLRENAKNWKIQSVYEKVDGSLLYFYELNGCIYRRTKRSIYNDQTSLASRIVGGNTYLDDFIKYWIRQGYTPMFELLSPMNEHVVQYDFTDLCFLALRNNTTGELHFADMDILPYKHNNIVSIFPISDTYSTIDEIIDVCVNDNTEDRKNVLEGYTVLFENGEIIKFKRHRYTELFRYCSQAMNDSYIAELLLNEKLDDMLSIIQEKSYSSNSIFGDAKHFIDTIIKCVDDTFNSRVSRITKFYRANHDSFATKKDYVFAIKEAFENDKIIFSLAMNLWDNNGVTDLTAIKEKYLREKMWRESKYYSEK